MRGRFAVRASTIVTAVLVAGAVAGQSYPSKPIRIVTGSPASGGDLIARIISQGITGPLGYPVVVDNRLGFTAAETVAKAPPDGYTLFVYTDAFWIATLLEKASYDPVRDFSPITLVAKSPNILVVHPALPAKSVQELIALAKSKPGALNYGSGPTGASNQLAAELFKALAGVNIVRIIYNGTALAINDLISGQIQVMFPTAASVTGHVKSGRLTALAVTTAQPSALAPGLPTLASSGVPGYESVQMSGVFAPAGTPSALIRRLNEEIVRVLNRPDVKEKLFNVGVEVVASSPEQLASAMKTDIVRLSKLIKDAGIKGD